MTENMYNFIFYLDYSIKMSYTVFLTFLKCFWLIMQNSAFIALLLLL